MHTGTVPVALDWLALPLDVDRVFFAETSHDVAGGPHLVGGGLGAFAEDLEFPLAFGDFGVDAFDIDTGIQADVDVGFDDLTSDVTDILEANTRVVRTLWGRIAGDGEAQWTTVFVEEIFLFETEPGARIIQNRRAGIGRVWGAIRHQHFRHEPPRKPFFLVLSG